MKILDRIMLNRLIAIITNFILSIVKILQKKDSPEVVDPNPSPENRPLRKKIKELKEKIFK